VKNKASIDSIRIKHAMGLFKFLITVFSSYLDPGGPTYTPMSRIKLKGENANDG